MCNLDLDVCPSSPGYRNIQVLFLPVSFLPIYLSFISFWNVHNVNRSVFDTTPGSLKLSLLFASFCFSVLVNPTPCLPECRSILLYHVNCCLYSIVYLFLFCYYIIWLWWIFSHILCIFVDVFMELIPSCLKFSKNLYYIYFYLFSDKLFVTILSRMCPLALAD